MKRIILYITSALIITSGTCIKINQDKSNEIIKETENYIQEFTEDDFEIAAHRGFSSREVENTAKSIQEAANKDYIDYIEIDARLTKDGKIVLSHDNDLNITPLDKITISEQSYETIIQKKFTYIPNTLETILLSSNRGEKYLITEKKLNLLYQKFNIISLNKGINSTQDKKILIDLKFNDDIKRFVEELQKELKDYDTSNIIFQSSNLLGIQYLQSKTNYNCLAIIDSEKDLQYLDLFENIGIRKNLITYEIIDQLLSKNKNVAIWTIDTGKELTNIIEELQEDYKDVIYITNYPDRIATELHNVETKNNIKTKSIRN